MKKRRIVSLLLAAAILAAALTGCANLRVGLMLLQHATGPYDPMDQVMEDRLNAILEAAVAQDAAAIKAQFAPNAIAVQPIPFESSTQKKLLTPFATPNRCSASAGSVTALKASTCRCVSCSIRCRRELRIQSLKCV